METELHQYARRMWCYGLLAGFSTAIATFSAFAAIAGPGDLAVFVMVISLSTALATGALAFAYVVGIVWETRHPISGIAAGFLMLLLGCLFGAGFLIVPRWVQNGLDRPANLCPIRPLPYSELG